MNETESTNVSNENTELTNSDKLYTQKEVANKILNTLTICGVITLLIVAFFVFQIFRITNLYTKYFDTENTSKYSRILKLYEENYVNEYNLEDSIDNSIYSFVKSINDKYGAYIPSKNHDFLGNMITQGDYQGIGLSLHLNEDGDKILIADVVEDSPAGKAGLKKGQTITKINGNEINETIYLELVKNIRENKYTEITFEIDNKDEITIKIGMVTTEKITYEVIDNIGYIKIHEFLGDTEKLFKQAIDDILKENINKIIFDLRDNTGGSAEIVIPMLDYILDDCLISTFEYKNGKTTTYRSDSNSKLPKDIPIYIIANKKSASASELFIMALQDNRNAKLIGETTFGKNTILSVFTFKDESMLVMSVGYYFSESHREIEGIGITPDIPLSQEELKLNWSDLTKYYN